MMMMLMKKKKGKKRKKKFETHKPIHTQISLNASN